FQAVSPLGGAALRVGFAALILCLLNRPRYQPELRQHGWVVVVYGLALACMNLSFYEAIARIPIGVAVALEFTGPLGVAIFHSRRRLDLLWVVLAGLGILLLMPVAGVDLDPLGILFALIAASLWASYILISTKAGQVLPGNQPVTWAMLIGAIAIVPFGLIHEQTVLLRPAILLAGLGVAFLGSVIPYSFEFMALRALPLQLFGVLMSLEPMVGALTGWLILRETLVPRTILAIILITIAAAGAARYRANSTAAPS
ncbi:MAG: EamA family transporter, partial [Cyanobacteria bacterium P01_H01_bin.121]